MSSPFAQLRSYQRNLRYQGYQSVPVEGFGGLNLVADPTEIGWSGAIDLLNVDFDQRGRMRSRDGYTAWSSTTSSSAYALPTYYPSNGTLVAFDGTTVRVFNSSGTQQAATGTLGASPFDAIAFGKTGTNYIYIAEFGSGMQRWDGAALTTPAGMPLAAKLAATADSRLAAGFISGHQDRVQFSDPGDAETWGANNYVDLMPGDGGHISAILRWSDLLFVFKTYTPQDRGHMFVFYGTSEDSTGNPIFNYRHIDTGHSVGARSAVAGPDGVYYGCPQGVFKTTGGTPVRVSEPIESWFTGQSTSFSQIPALIPTSNAVVAAYAIGPRLAFQVANNDGCFVYDTRNANWTYWNLLPSTATWIPSPFNAQESLIGNIGGGVSKIMRLAVGQTTDNGTSISSRYRSGFFNAPGRSRADGRQVIRQWKLKGAGTVNFGVSADDATAIPTTGGGAQASVALAGPYPNYRTAQLGYDFSWQVSSTSAFTLSSVEADIA